jgi:hypothetical protein
MPKNVTEPTISLKFMIIKNAPSEALTKKV